MNDWSGLFLGIIAFATLVMALLQVGAAIAALRIAKQAQEILTSVQRDIKPLVSRANEIAGEASRTAALATAQAQKIDTLVTDLTRRVDETSLVVQQAIVTPAREGIAILAAIRAAIGAFRDAHDFRGRARRHADEEDPLFIG